MKDRYTALIVIAVLSLFFYGLYIGIDHSNNEFKKNTWYQTGIVLEKSETLRDVESLIEGEEGVRYTEKCDICMLGDTVTLKMQKEEIVRITTSISAEEQK